MCREWATAPPSSSLSIATPVNSVTIVGPDTKAYERSVITTWSTMPRRSAGPETAGPSTIMTVGTLPEQSVRARAASPHPCKADIPSVMSAPDEAMTATSGICSSTAVRAPVSMIDEASLLSAPLWKSPLTSTHTTERSAQRLTSARAAPGTRDRRGTVMG